jgi:hypothetical protein
MKNILFILPLLLIFSGCVSSETSLRNKNPYLRPMIVTGEYEDLFDLAKEVASIAYSLDSELDMEMSADPSNGIITVKRNDFRKGDTIINITFTKESENKYTINVSSKGYGMNPPIYPWGRSDDEVKTFTTIYSERYEKYRKSLGQK